MNFLDSLFALSVVLGFCLYFYIRHRFTYWKRLNIPYIKPQFPFGNIRGIGRTIHMSHLFERFYKQLKGQGQFGGIYFFINPIVLAIDVEFVKTVLIKDFHYFVSRGLYYNETDDPLSAHLIAVDGDKWRGLRSILTPTFTSGKLKLMFPMVLDVANELKNAINDAMTGNNVEIELKDLLARFTTDILGTCAFGIDCNSLKDPNNEFRKHGRDAFDKPRNSFLMRLFLNSFRDLGRKLKVKMVADDVANFFTNSLIETMRYRERNNVVRNDFLHMMMQLQKYGKLLGDGNDQETLNGNDKLTFDEAAAQCFVFFMAGFETSSTALTFCLYELSLNLEIQKKARQEVLDVLRRYDGVFTYEAMTEMRYVDQCVRESLRKYPPLALLFRECTKDYPVPASKMFISKGTSVMIPVYAIHHDAEFYPNPDSFDPDRFLPENVAKRHPQSYIPFGDGPRNCIALRFGLMQTIVGMVTFLKNYELSPTRNTKIPLVLSTKSLVLTPADGVCINAKYIGDD